MKNLKCRIEDLEVRTCDENLLSHGTAETMSIVRWNKNVCFCLAYWTKDSEGYNLNFIKGRPFDDDIDKEEFWLLAEIGQKHLTKWFEEQNE